MLSLGSCYDLYPFGLVDLGSSLGVAGLGGFDVARLGVRALSTVVGAEEAMSPTVDWKCWSPNTRLP